MSGTRRIQIGVLGAAAPSREIARAAERIGELVAARGAVVVCGGLGGVMEAAARGARGAGGLVVGILPGTDHSEANAYVSAAVATDMGHARNAVIIRSSDAAIAVGGGYGTLSEIALAMKCGVPVVGYRTWEARQEGGLTAPELTAGTPEEAVEKAFEKALLRR